MKIVLIGYMASGKSAMGRAVSEQLGLEHVDLDWYIEEREGKTIPQIFESEGEDGFRKKETSYLMQLMDRDTDMVLSLGGGTPCFNSNMEHLRGKCHSIYLNASPETLTSRLLRSRNPRPLVQGKSEDELSVFVRQTLEKREKYYLMADHVMSVDTLSIQESADALMRLIKEKIINSK